MADILSVPWDRIREGNRVVAPGQSHRVVIVTHVDNRHVEVLFDDGTRERHLADEPTQVLLRESRS